MNKREAYELLKEYIVLNDLDISGNTFEELLRKVTNMLSAELISPEDNLIEILNYIEENLRE